MCWAAAPACRTATRRASCCRRCWPSTPTVNGDRQAEISAALGTDGQPAAEVLDRFIAGLGLPRRLRDVGVKRDDLQRIATNCMLDDWTFTNPRTINGAQEIVPILELVY